MPRTPQPSATPMTDQHERAVLLAYGYHYVVESVFARRLEKSHSQLLEALRAAQFAMRAPLDGWKGEVERVALDKARDAIDAAQDLS